MTVRSNALLRVVVLLTVAVAALFLLLAGQVDAGDSVLLTQEHVVRSGETLWDIAGAHTADGADVRETVAEIKAMNVLGGSVIFPGDRLVIPLIEG
jgi:nucleoid-associated protein YgaU